MKKAPLALLTAAACALAPAFAQAQAPADRWTFSVAPYLWLPSVDGTLRYGPPPPGGSTANVSVDADTLLDNLDFAFMLMGQARKGRWLVATDVIYLDFGAADSTVRSIDFNPGPGAVNVSSTAVNAGTDTDIKGWVWTLVGGYAAVEGPRATLDVLAGFRYLDLEATTNWQLGATVTGPAGAAAFARTGSVGKSEDVLAAIVGAKGRVKLGDGNWFMNYYADVGGSGSIFTWQGMAGVGYAFKWGELILDYRYLYFSQDGERLIDNVSFGGFALGANFRF
jgi:opacity protein-like surface antigen